jgi:hypothetical protein
MTTTQNFSDLADRSAHIVMCDGEAAMSDLGADDTREMFARCHRILKPGGFLFAFASPRLFHRVAVAVEDSVDLGLFEMRDAITWVHGGVVDHETGLNSQATLICLAQKAKEGTFVDNWSSHEVGLIDTSAQWAGKFPTNIIEGPECDRADIAAHLLRVFSLPGHTVADAWMTSEDFRVAALREGGKFLGLAASAKNKAAA